MQSIIPILDRVYNAVMDIPEQSTRLAVACGMRVELELLCESGVEYKTFVIVPDDQADYTQGFIGEGTPMVKAILGRKSGQVVNYQSGDVKDIHILAVSTADLALGDESAASRKEALRKAVRQVERMNAIVFASSFSGKWGDYDPEGIDHWEDG